MVVKCPIDGRSFKTEAAYKQHAAVVHRSGVAGPRRRRVAKATPQPRAAMPGVVSSGVDLAAAVSVSRNASVGTVLLNLPLGPATLNPSRLRNESTLWSRWRPQQLKLHVVASGSAMTYGSVCVAWCPDDVWTPSGSAADYMRVAALKPSVTMRLHESRTLVVPIDTLTKWYMCDGSPDMSTHGTLLAVVAAQPGGYDRGSIGLTLTLEWKVQFQGVEMPGTSTAIDDIIQPDSGWTNLFTTSDGSFNAERLTLKMHSGGDMAPFSAAREDHIYEPVSGVKVPYYDESSTLKECRFFAKVQGWATPGLLCFGSRADAAAYITSGDVTKALKYKAAGPLSTPAIIHLQGTAPTFGMGAPQPPIVSIAHLLGNQDVVEAVHKPENSCVLAAYRIISDYLENFGAAPTEWCSAEGRAALAGASSSGEVSRAES